MPGAAALDLKSAGRCLQPRSHGTSAGNRLGATSRLTLILVNGHGVWIHRGFPLPDGRVFFFFCFLNSGIQSWGASSLQVRFGDPSCPWQLSLYPCTTLAVQGSDRQGKGRERCPSPLRAPVKEKRISFISGEEKQMERREGG